MAKKTATETPLMKQHGEIKSRYPDAILLFRVGDFYETFGEDAVIASKILGITLTKRANGVAAYIELAGFPHHALDTYLHKLVKAGYRVAICDQLEDPKTVKGIVKRGVTELVTPGVATSDRLLDNKTNNFLAAVFIDDKECGIAFIDISTGECFVAQGNMEYMDKLLQSFQPSEVLVSKGKQKIFKEELDQKYYTYALEDWIFQHHYAYELLIKHFQIQSLKGFGLEDWNAAIIAAGAAFHYFKDTEHPHLQHLTSLQQINAGDFLWMDRFTIRNLELLHSPAEHGFTLLNSIDETITPMGSRMLKRWLIFPLVDLPQIETRHDIVQTIFEDEELNAGLRQHLKAIGDIERLVAKVPLKKINPREVIQLARSLQHADAIKDLPVTAAAHALNQILAGIQATTSIQEVIHKYIKEEPAVAIHKGNVMNDGIHEELDNLRQIAFHGKEYLAKIQETESVKTGIPSLKIAFNNVFGYYLEVTNTHKDKVPAEWIRKQTLANAERYITPELKEYEEKILGAEEKMLAIEGQLYEVLLDQLQLSLKVMQSNAQLIAQIDCLQSLATIAKKCKYVRPEMAADPVLDIRAGRHPVIEQHLPPGEEYVHNDVLLNKEEQQIIILTGPNMSGKSALLRQTALITLMAHMGSFVPASKAIIGLTDKIFTRVGASDNLSGGESTFMVEMNETASIINNLSNRSLVLLDEIGRGTSTYDGISIAWSIVEFIQKHPNKAKTIFATHYHELNELEHKFEGIKNYHITHKETANKVIFLRKLAPGGSRHSFGIQVAKMAGMPVALTHRADEILAVLEEKNKDNQIGNKMKQIHTDTFQLNIFDGLSTDLSRIKEILFQTDINTLTPVEALMKLNELKNVIKVYQD
ncbi:DNA mismatch repair protein MutS [Taibaiella sp. KBW10]|uniref:DNA mismatch repair protein MutS n=1 Tax=Taibaiella sp. KBW10 TaxID=2153357 RepID=UPI000F595DEB|nr:DNA mismatch repair protein MutS [Taibaiella sp. KBW10]RQO31241.1 DNA mismatch repair protein MutS [Taibaiella sp. KBW10]